MTVKDEEVTVEKYYSPEEKQRMEEAAKLEEERRKAEMVTITICPIGIPISVILRIFFINFYRVTIPESVLLI